MTYLGRVCLAVIWLSWPLFVQGGNAVVIYETGFELSEGYDPDRDLDGQQGWLGVPQSPEDDFNTGLVPANPGLGEYSAYIGGVAPAEGASSHVWRPLDPAPDPASFPFLRFSVFVEMNDSLEVEQYDDFCWEAYNQDDQRLFTLVFNNFDLGVYYVLENGTNAVFTGFEFVHEQVYELEFFMNFAQNLWSARIDGEVIVNGAPISEFGSMLNVGDVDAAWIYENFDAPGDNFMVFDEYRIEVFPASAQPSVRFVERLSDGRARVEIGGLPGCAYVLEASVDLQEWTEVATVSGGLAEVTDPGAPGMANRFYRARLVE